MTCPVCPCPTCAAARQTYPPYSPYFPLPGGTLGMYQCANCWGWYQIGSAHNCVGDGVGRGGNNSAIRT